MTKYEITHPIEYRAWNSMKSRCYNKSHTSYRNYGGRGIQVCERWRYDFPTFLNDMGNRPSKHTLDRIDNDGNYTPGNCRWATYKEQLNNKRGNRLLTLDGKTQTVSQWSTETGIKYWTLSQRVGRYGWSDEDALTKPVRKHTTK